MSVLCTASAHHYRHRHRHPTLPLSHPPTPTPPQLTLSLMILSTRKEQVSVQAVGHCVCSVYCLCSTTTVTAIPSYPSLTPPPRPTPCSAYFICDDALYQEGAGICQGCRTLCLFCVLPLLHHHRHRHPILPFSHPPTPTPCSAYFICDDALYQEGAGVCPGCRTLCLFCVMPLLHHHRHRHPTLPLSHPPNTHPSQAYFICDDALHQEGAGVCPGCRTLCLLCVLPLLHHHRHRHPTLPLSHPLPPSQHPPLSSLLYL